LWFCRLCICGRKKVRWGVRRWNFTYCSFNEKGNEKQCHLKICQRVLFLVFLTSTLIQAMTDESYFVLSRKRIPVCDKFMWTLETSPTSTPMQAIIFMSFRSMKLNPDRFLDLDASNDCWVIFCSIQKTNIGMRYIYVNFRNIFNVDPDASNNFHVIPFHEAKGENRKFWTLTPQKSQILDSFEASISSQCHPPKKTILHMVKLI